MPAEADPALLRVAEVAVRGARALARLAPPGLRKRVEDTVFHYIFQKTRVENDAYGWRPDTPGGGEVPAPYRARPPARDG